MEAVQENTADSSLVNACNIDPNQVAMAVVRTDLGEHVEVDAVSQPVHTPTERRFHSGELNPRSKAGFLHIYGWMGVPMVIIFLMSAAWTIALAIIQQIPEQIANWLMNTTALDEGTFWLLPKPGLDLSISASVLLVLFGVGYISLVVLMLFPDKMIPSLWNHPRDIYDHSNGIKSIVSLNSLGTKRGGESVHASTHHNELQTASKVNPIDYCPAPSHDVQGAKKLAQQQKTIWGLSWERLKFELTSPDGLLHQYYNPMLDLPKLVFQTTTLLTYLHNGFPIVVIFIYTCALYINWIISAYHYKRERPDPHFVTSRIFYSFDLFFAVFAPLEVLVYAYYTFHFDLAEFATRLETMSPGVFDRFARLFADPTQVSMFRIAYHYLQFTTTGTLLIKCALNALSLFKWWKTILHLVEHARTPPIARNSTMLGSFERLALDKIRRRKHLQNLLVAALFFWIGTAVFIYSIVAVETTRHVCKPHLQCKVPSYQWNVGEALCSCIVFVDRETRLKTVAEWEDPPETTVNLAALAATGHLRIIQIVNRELPTLPAELRRCQDLEQIILLYTKILTIPDWAKEFKHLEYLHIEGDLTTKQLTYMPRDLFTKTPHLLFLHLGSLIKLPFVPELDNLHELGYLALAMLHSITEIPSLMGLRKLERLSIVDNHQVYTLPPVHQLTKLKSFVLAFRNPVCCNGFVTGKCNLTDFSCLNRTATGEPLVQCTSERMAPEDYKTLISTKGQACDPNLTYDLMDIKPSYETTDVACGGVVFKQCSVKGQTGICYPARMQPISCQFDPGYEAMRRLQIQRSVGESCDPKVEAWLGCKA